MVYQIYKNVSIKGRRAVYFAHSNKLEMIWTIIPAIVLSGLIAYGSSKFLEFTIYPYKNIPKHPVTSLAISIPSITKSF